MTEFGRNRLLRIRLEAPGKVARLGLTVAYQFIGPAPDSMRSDPHGNVNVALNGQGRVLILGSSGIPIGNVLLPGRDEGRHLRTSSLALKPNGDEIYIVSANEDGTSPAAVFRARLAGY